MLRRSLVSVVAVCCFLLTGCGSSDFADVTGTVTYNGAPVPNATVLFIPQQEGGMSVGTTDGDGAFTLKVTGGSDQPGARVGTHDISVTATTVEAVKNSKSVQQTQEFGSMAMGITAAPKEKPLIPPKYGSSRTSGLTFEVKAGEANVATLELTD